MKYGTRLGNAPISTWTSRGDDELPTTVIPRGTFR